MNEINLNGQIINSEEKLAGKDHRGLKYGDGLFESIRMLDGTMPFLTDHLRRLYRGMRFLKIDKPKHFNTVFFRKEIKQITGIEKNARIRLSLFRTAGGLYTPTKNTASYLIEYQPIKPNHWQWLKNGLNVKICPTIQLPITAWSGLKTANSLPYILAGLWKTEAGLDDCILLNQKGFVAEASSSNIFYFKNKVLYTSTDQSGAILGVMRKQVIKRAKENGIKLIKKEVPPSELLAADEVFLTNAIQGIRWIKTLGKVQFKKENTLDLFQKI